MHKTRTIIGVTTTISLLLIALAACGGANASNPQPTGTPNPAQVQPTDTAMALITSTPADVQAAATVTPAPPSDTPATGEPTVTPNYPPAATAAVTAAKAHLAKALGIRPEEISVVEVTNQVWTENGLSCPASMGIARLNIPGYRIILKVKKSTYEYHTNQDASIVRACTNTTGSTGSDAGASAGAGPGAGAGSAAGSGDASGTGGAASSNAGGNLTQDQITAAAKQDLATRLGSSTSSISLKSVTVEQWRDSGLGCGKGGAYLQVITPGYLVVLSAENQDYEYHTDMSGRVLLCVNGEPAK